MGGDVPIDSEASVVTLSISRLGPLTHSLGGAHKVECVCVLKDEYVHVYVSVCVRTVFRKKKVRESPMYL